MTDKARKPNATPNLGPAPKDEESSVRERARAEGAPRRGSDPNFSLGERLETKLATAHALLAKLEPQDARARLLHIAVLRRDESLLDGILVELTMPTTTTRRSR